VSTACNLFLCPLPAWLRAQPAHSQHLPCAAPHADDIKPVQAVENGDGLQVALSGDNAPDLLTTEWKL
jgi:hypothetical protein